MSTTKAQTFDVDTLLWNGDINKRVNLVILGDGYQQSEMTKFATDANNFMTDFFLASPFKEYKNYFNVLIINMFTRTDQSSTFTYESVLVEIRRINSL